MSNKSIVAEWRSVMGYTQQDAAEALGVSLSTIKKWEGAISGPSYAHLVVMAMILEGMAIPQPYSGSHKKAA